MRIMLLYWEILKPLFSIGSFMSVASTAAPRMAAMIFHPSSTCFFAFSLAVPEIIRNFADDKLIEHAWHSKWWQWRMYICIVYERQ